MIDFVFPWLLILPMVMHWLLPDSIEQLFYANLFDIVFFIPDFFYIAYILLYVNKKQKCACDVTWLKMVCLMLFLYSTFLLLYNIGLANTFDIINIILNNYCYIYFPLIFFCFPLSRDEMERTKILIIPAAVIISVEIVLYSTGILSYTSSTGNSLTNDLYRAGDVFRVSTTIGAATGTSIVLLLLGVISTSFYKISQSLRVILLFLFTVSMFMTMSRGAIISWSIYLVIYLYVNFFKKKSFIVKTTTILAVVLSLCGLNWTGVFNPIIERNEKLENVGFDSGRNERFAYALDVFQSSYALGVGSGQIFPDKSISHKIDVKYKGAPHNVYLIYLAELGIVGLCLVLMEMFLLLKKLDYRSVMGLMIAPIFLLNMNTEGVFVTQEYFSLLMLYILLSPREKKMEVGFA